MSSLNRRAAALATLLLTAALAACGGGGGGGSSTSSDTGSSTGSSGSGGSGTGSSGNTGTGTGTSTGTLPVATGNGTTWLVGTGGTLPAGAQRVATPSAIAWASLPAGSVVLITPGTYAGVTTVTAVGTAANPIVVTAYDTTNPPVLTDSVDFQGAAYVQVSHVSVQSPTYAGFIIRLASHHLTISDATVTGGTDGVNITDGAGIGHQILRNTLSGASIDGIDAEVDGDATDRTLIQHNTISGSGVHGIELRASHYDVDDNTVTGSGQTTGGASGIHIFSGSPTEGSGTDNRVRWNASYGNLDTRAYDGNGIEVDQWCNGNTIAFNLVWGNDGAGVILYDASDNVVQNNTAWSNGVDSGHMMAARGEIVVSGTAAATATGNQVWNNIAAATRAAVSAIVVDDSAVAGGNTVGANLLSNTAGGTLLRWTDSATRATAATIDATTGTTGNVVQAPAFKDTTAPLTGGLALTAQPALAGVLPTGWLDFAGASPVSGDTFFGAYYTAP